MFLPKINNNMYFDFFTISIFILGFWLGSRYAAFMITQKFLFLAKQHGISLDKHDGAVKVSTIYDCNIEIHQDIMYLFEKNTNTFLCQGKSFEEIEEKLKTYLGITQAKITFENKQFYFINGKFKEEFK